MRTIPTCSPFGPTSRTSGTRMRSLMRGSTLMAPPCYRELYEPSLRATYPEDHDGLQRSARRPRQATANHQVAVSP
jgi:hypothetical protein